MRLERDYNRNTQWSESVYIKTLADYKCVGQFDDSCDDYDPRDEQEPAYPFYVYDPPPTPDPAPQPRYDSNGEPIGKANAKTCHNGEPCNDPPVQPPPRISHEPDPEDYIPPRHPSAPPKSYFVNGEPPDKKNFKTCYNGDPCND